MKWSTNDTKTVKKLYRNTDNNTIGNLVGRTGSSVACKANRMGLKKSKRFLASINKKTNI